MSVVSSFSPSPTLSIVPLSTVFDVLVDDNNIGLTIYNKFKDAKNTNYPSKITIQAKGIYDSTQQQD